MDTTASKDSETWLDPEEVEPDWQDGSATIEILYGEGETRRGAIVEWNVLTADLGSFMWRPDRLCGQRFLDMGKP